MLAGSRKTAVMVTRDLVDFIWSQLNATRAHILCRLLWNLLLIDIVWFAYYDSYMGSSFYCDKY